MHLSGNQVVWATTLAFTLYAGWIDGHTRRIPNWLTVPGFLAGVAVQSSLNGWHGALASLEGTGLALALLLPLLLLRALGAGDWKLMGAVGSLLGPDACICITGQLLGSGIHGRGTRVLRQAGLQRRSRIWSVS